MIFLQYDINIRRHEAQSKTTRGLVREYGEEKNHLNCGEMTENTKVLLQICASELPPPPLGLERSILEEKLRRVEREALQVEELSCCEQCRQGWKKRGDEWRKEGGTLGSADGTEMKRNSFKLNGLHAEKY